MSARFTSSAPGLHEVGRKRPFIAALGAAPQTVVTFDGDPVGTIAGNEYSGQGLLFDAPFASAGYPELEIAPPDFFASTLYGASANVIVSHAAPASNFFGIIASEAISRVYVDELANDSDDVGYDTFRLATTAALSNVPAPGSLALLLLGMLGAAACGRRQRTMRRR